MEVESRSSEVSLKEENADLLLLSYLCRIIFGAKRQLRFGGYSTADVFHFGEFTLDQSRYQLQRGGRTLPLEKRPMELLLLLVEKRGELVSREEVADRLWGADVFVDIDQGINTAVRKVRRALRDDPEKPRYIETVVGKGYRFAAPVTCNGAILKPATEPASQHRSSEATAREATATGWVAKKAIPLAIKLVLGALIVLTVGIIAWRLKSGRGSPSTAQPRIRSLAVLPLKNLSGDPAQEYLADGMTEELISRLSNIRDLRVVSRTSVMRFKDTKLSLPEISKMLGADVLMEGSVMREGNRIRVHAQLVHGASDEHFWSESYDRELGDVFALESDVAQSIAEKIKATLTGTEQQRLTKARPVAPEVYESYLKGRFDWNNAFNKGDSAAGMEQSIRDFEEAIKKDPTFAPAYAGLAGAYDSMGSIYIGASPKEYRPKVISAARKALELDPDLSDAHILIADIDEKEWRWSEAEAEYRRVLELNPNHAEAHFALAEWMMCQGRTDEAVVWAQRGRELDPSTDSGDDIGWILFNARRYDDAIREFRSVLAVHPDEPNALWSLGFVLIANNQVDEAIRVLEKVTTVSGRSPAIIGLLANAYAHAGRRKEALRLLGEIKNQRSKRYVPAAAFVSAYLGFGDRNQLFFWLEQAYKEQSNLLRFLKVLPLFDPFRDDPRFKDLLHRVGLDQNL